MVVAIAFVAVEHVADGVDDTTDTRVDEVDRRFDDVREPRCARTEHSAERAATRPIADRVAGLHAPGIFFLGDERVEDATDNIARTERCVFTTDRTG